MLAVIVLAVVPFQQPVTDRVELLEVNHFYDDHGRRLFTQLIGWTYNLDEQRQEVVFWRILKHPSMSPVRHDSGVSVLWWDGTTLRRIHAHARRESFTQHDPEMTHRRVLPQGDRRGLTKLRVSTRHEQ